MLTIERNVAKWGPGLFGRDQASGPQVPRQRPDVKQKEETEKGKERVWFPHSICLFLAKAPVTHIEGCISHVAYHLLASSSTWVKSV